MFSLKKRRSRRYTPEDEQKKFKRMFINTVVDLTIGVALLLFFVYVVWDPIRSIELSVYQSAVESCTSAGESGVEKLGAAGKPLEGKPQEICETAFARIKPPESDDPGGRFQKVADAVLEPIKNWFFDRFYLPDPKIGPGPLSALDLSAQSNDESGNPTPEAVAQKAQQLEGKYGISAKYVFSMCFYESGGLNQYSTAGVLTQGVNRNTDGSVSSTDWGMCQINDKYHPDLMAQAKKDWVGNLEASFVVASQQCKAALGSNNDSKALYGCYNGSGPNGVYAQRVYKIESSGLWEKTVSNLRDRLVAVQNDRVSERAKSGGDIAAVETVNLAVNVPVYDGQAANIAVWARNNPTIVIPGSGKLWSFCQQTDQSGWGNFKIAAGINAGGICANATMLDKMAHKVPGLVVGARTQHDGNSPFYTVAVNCPSMDYTITNTTGKDIVLKNILNGNVLNLEWVH